MQKKKESFFWTSYSDLMTSLFFIMLVLFVLVIVLLHSRMQVTEQRLHEIEEVEKSTEELNNNGYFRYNEEHKKYILTVKVFFPVGTSEISELSVSARDSLKSAGKEIVNFLRKHSDTKYLLIVEGQASMNSEAYSPENYKLSFLRAYSLLYFWRQEIGNFGNNCEIQLAGSGDGRLNTDFKYSLGGNRTDRTAYNKALMREMNESDNQRFLIHIIPKNILEASSK